MDKKKVKELIEKAMSELSATNLDIIHTQAILAEALGELSKSDWISVEDRQPPKNKVVLVCNKENSNDLVLAYRINKETMRIVYPNNIVMYAITHWKPIEKLED